MDIKNVGKAPAENVQHWSHAYIDDDYGLTSQENALESFEKWVATNPSVGGNTVQAGETFWVTIKGEVLSPEDRQNILTGRRVVYALLSMKFTDDFGNHEYHVCEFLSPPQGEPPNMTMIWNFCSLYNEEK